MYIYRVVGIYYKLDEYEYAIYYFEKYLRDKRCGYRVI